MQNPMYIDGYPLRSWAELRIEQPSLGWIEDFLDWVLGEEVTENA